MAIIQNDAFGVNFIEQGGFQRKLASFPSRGKMKAMLPNYKKAGNPMVPRTAWKEISRRDLFNWIMDQGNHGSCFPKKTRIRMADGTEKPIEEIRLLDQVVTAEGNVGLVTKTFVRQDANEVINVMLWGHNHIRMTEEHPVLTKRGYVPASDLQIGDQVAMTKYMSPVGRKTVITAEHVSAASTRWMIKSDRTTIHAGVSGRAKVASNVKSLPDMIQLTPGFGRIIGLFLAEGNTDSSRVVWTFNANERDTLVADLLRLLNSELGIEGRIQQRKNALKVVVYGKMWSLLFESLCATGSGVKRLHSDLTSASRECQVAIFRGWLSGDGHFDKHTINGVTVSRDLAIGMFDIAQAIGFRPTIRYSEPAASHGVKVRQPRWDVEVARGDSDNYSEQDDRYVWRKVKGLVRESFIGPVYNFEVQGDNSYVAEGIGVHNCVANAWAGALRRARALAGCKDVALSPGWWYSLINDNQDNGAVISDGIESGMNIGTCSYDLVGEDPIYQSDMPAGVKAEALKYRIKSAYHCDSWEELGSALQSGFIPVYGFQVGRNFMNLDSNGIAGYDSGPGNHCNHADTMVQVSGQWYMGDVNSWGVSWGQNGRCLIGQKHLFNSSDEPDVCVISAVLDSPDDPNDPPASGDNIIPVDPPAFNG